MNIYSSGGRKFSVIHKSSIEKHTDYVGNMIYENGSLKRVLVDGGYIEGGIYYFYLQNHLGNNRVVAKSDGTVVQTTHYYPYGMSFAESIFADKQPYKYNGKELDTENGLNLYDYDARQMNVTSGRFTSIDPLAEKYYSISPYVYCANNPINAFDLYGDSIWYSVQDNIVTMHVTAKVFNNSSDNINVNRAANDIASGINKSFSGNFEYDGQIYTLQTDIQIEAVSSMDNVTNSDHLFVIEDADGESARGATSMMGGKVLTLASQDYANDNWFSNTFVFNNTRTAVHEFGHAAGLTHKTASGQSNLLKQSGSGTNVTSNQRAIMWKNRNLINRGPNSYSIGRYRVPYPYVHDSTTGKVYKVNHLLNWNKMMGRK